VLLTAPTPASIGAALQEPEILMLGALSNRLTYQFVANVCSVPELRGKRLAISRPGDASYSLALKTLGRASRRRPPRLVAALAPLQGPAQRRKP
jgi:hypothetical protein